MTIYALSSGPGIAGVAVVRISGPDTEKILKTLIKGKFPEPRKATLKKVYNIKDNILKISPDLAFSNIPFLSKTNSKKRALCLFGGRPPRGVFLNTVIKQTLFYKMAHYKNFRISLMRLLDLETYRQWIP